ncbi:MAG: hypothetical protein M0036_16875 [Desulfobacteraceae bacterium]|nr:hypothetical protein [Desulfobacteraceae bacterium]
MMLTAEELLAGSQLTFTIDLPPEVLSPGGNGSLKNAPQAVRLKPLTVSDLQIISRAAKESDQLIAALMVQRSLVEPALSVAEAAAMPIGLMQHLLLEVNRISGITTEVDDFSSSLEAPMVKATFLLAKEFGWTPQQVNELTLGQILLHLQMMKQCP